MLTKSDRDLSGAIEISVGCNMAKKKGKKKRKPLPKLARPDLDELLAERYHGASNISGIRYQVLYSVLKSFELYYENTPDARMRLEGIEDVDLLGFRFGSKFIQAKNYQKDFTWSLLDEPLQNFVQVHLTDPSCTFLLVLGGPMRKGLEAINDFPDVKGPKLKHLKKKLKERSKAIGVSLQDALAVTERLEIVSIPEQELMADLNKSLAENFELGAEGIDIYVCALTAQFLEWAEERRTISRADVDAVRAAVGEKMSAEEQFEAFGRGLIDRIKWLPDRNATDFFDGKATRPGHIVANLDVPRPLWLERIDSAFESVKVCVVLSSSGQGKSTLLFRYARQQQFFENPFLLRIAETREQVELVIRYLRFWSQLVPSALVLVDNAGWSTRLWPLVAQECAALGIKVLVSSRQEDWHRFRQESLTGYELVEPVLSLDEARDIFSIFRREKRVHKDVISADWAYERIGQPHLLMEYVYLLTHGQMLEERLRDQVRQVQQQAEDRGKIEVLRRVSLAHMLGCHLKAANLLDTVALQRDPKETMESLEQEYLTIENGNIKGLHWVRSDHLARILHDPVPAGATTALATLDAVPQDQVRSFVGNALSNDLILKDQFLEGLIEIAKSKHLGEILIFLEGTFEGGERGFFEAQKDVFEEALQIFGWSGPNLLGLSLLPTVEESPFGNLCGETGSLGDMSRALGRLAAKCRGKERGKELCAEFLKRLVPNLDPQELLEHFGETGRLLDWCHLCGVQIPVWGDVKLPLATDPRCFAASIGDFCAFAQGLGRYDADTYQQWLDTFNQDVLGFLRYQVDCVTLEIRDDTVLAIFLVHGQEDFNEQAVSRLRKLRSALPLCKHYQSQGIWGMPYGLMPPVDDTKKDIGSDHLLFDSDVAKNRAWDEVVERYFLPDSFYRYEKEWHRVRLQALDFVNWLITLLSKILSKGHPAKDFLDRGDAKIKLLKLGLKLQLNPPTQTPKEVQDVLKTSTRKWASDLENFVGHIIDYYRDRDENMGNLAVFNFRGSRRRLSEVHDAFDALFMVAPDYFAAARVNKMELARYALLEDHLYTWILDPPVSTPRDIAAYARRRRRDRVQANLRRVEQSFTPLIEGGATVIIGNDIYEEDSLSHLPIAVSVEDPIHPEEAIMSSLRALSGVKDVADFVYIIPLHKGNRLIEGAYRFAVHKMDEILARGLEVWDYLISLELPEPIKKLLPDLPDFPCPELQIIGNVNVLLGQLHPLAVVKEYASQLSVSSNRFDLAQAERLAAYVQELGDKAKALAKDIAELIVSEFPEARQDASLEPSLQFLEAVMAATGPDDLVKLHKSVEYDEKAIVSSLVERAQNTG